MIRETASSQRRPRLQYSAAGARGGSPSRRAPDRRHRPSPCICSDTISDVRAMSGAAPPDGLRIDRSMSPPPWHSTSGSIWQPWSAQRNSEAARRGGWPRMPTNATRLRSAAFTFHRSILTAGDTDRSLILSRSNELNCSRCRSGVSMTFDLGVLVTRSALMSPSSIRLMAWPLF